MYVAEVVIDRPKYSTVRNGVNEWQQPPPPAAAAEANVLKMPGRSVFRPRRRRPV